MSKSVRKKTTVSEEVGGSSKPRTPYQDFRRLMVCYHEAGHAVVGHALGWELSWVNADLELDRTMFKPVPREEPCFGEDKAEKQRRVAALRLAMTVFAAGPVANVIHQRAVEARGFVNRVESRAYENHWTIGISVRFGTQMVSDDPASDYCQIVQNARSVCVAFKPMPLIKFGPGGACTVVPPRKSKPVTDEQVLAEVVKSERAAERILKRHWPAVEDIAVALHKSKSGHLNRKQLLTRLKNHGVVEHKTMSR